jgi:hypothetical protein
VIVWAALPEILAGSRIGCIRGVKDVLIGQLLVSIRAAALETAGRVLCGSEKLMTEKGDYVFPPLPRPSLSVRGTGKLFPVHRIYCVGPELCRACDRDGPRSDTRAALLLPEEPG